MIGLGNEARYEVICIYIDTFCRLHVRARFRKGYWGFSAGIGISTTTVDRGVWGFDKDGLHIWQHCRFAIN